MFLLGREFRCLLLSFFFVGLMTTDDYQEPAVDTNLVAWESVICAPLTASFTTRLTTLSVDVVIGCCPRFESKPKRDQTRTRRVTWLQGGSSVNQLQHHQRRASALSATPGDALSQVFLNIHRKGNPRCWTRPENNPRRDLSRYAEGPSTPSPPRKPRRTNATPNL